MDTPTKSPNDAKNVNPFLKVIFILVAIPSMAVWESAKYLCRKAYDETSTGLSYVFGVLSALAGGIGTGYYLGWMHTASLGWWLGGGVLAAVLSFAYAWPLLYLVGFKKAIRLSEYLWEHVDYSRRSESWLSGFLMFLGYAAAVLGGIGLGFYTMVHAHAWFGWTGFMSLIAWALSLVVGAFVGGGAGSILWSFIRFGRIPLIAFITDAAMTYTLYGVTTAYVAEHGWHRYFGFGASAAEFLLYIAYVFPTVHILLSQLDDVFEYLWDIYDEDKGGYREFFLQVVNIAAAWRFASLSFLLWAFFGLTNHFVVIGLVAAVALLSYTLVGKLLNKAGNFLVGSVVALHVAYFSGMSYFHHDYWFGIPGAVVAGILSGLLTLGVVYPIAYVIVRFCTNFLIASWARGLLVGLHEGVCKACGNVIDEVFDANENTYGDRTPYRELFLQLANLGTAYGAYIGSVALCHTLSFSLGLTIPTVALGVFLSYVLVGKLLQKVGNHVVGVLVGLAGGVFVGTWSYAVQPWGLYVAIPVGLLGAALTYGFVFPVAYIFTRAIVNVVRPEKWAQPFLTYTYNTVWNVVASTWAEFMQTYRAVRTWFAPSWATVVANWQSAKQTIKDTWESATKRK